MIPKCCCNPAACNYVSDDFTRANETPVASPWVKLTGTNWNLASNVLDAVAAADYKHTTAFPGASGDSRTAVVDFKLSTDGSVEVQTGKTDENNYFAAKLTHVSGDCAILTAFCYVAGVGGSCTPGPTVTDCVQVWGLTTGVWYRLRVCLIPNTGSYGYETQDKVIAVISFPNDATRTPISCQTTAEGPSVGTLSGLKSTMAAQFDNFTASYYRDSPSGQHRTCPWCHTGCAISQDAFTTDEPCLWDVVSGSYSVSGGLMTIGTSPSKIQHHIFHPGLKTTHKVTVDVQDNGTESKVYIGNGYAKLTYSAGLRTLTLYDNSDTLLDTDVQTVSVTSDSSLYMALTLCYSRGVLSCTVTGRGSSLCVDSAMSETTDGYWAALGGNSGAVFDNFVFSKTYDSTAPSDAACDHCDSCPATCTACIDGTIENEIVATIYGIGTGSGGDGPPPHYQCAWPMTGEDDSDINGTSWACVKTSDNAFNQCCQWVPAGPTAGAGTAYRVWQSDFLIWNDCLHPSVPDPSNGSDPCGTDEATGCGGLIPTSTDLGYKRVMRLYCVDICANGDVLATVLIWSGVYNPPTTATQTQQIITFKTNLGTGPFDCSGNFPLRLDFWGFDGSIDDCGSGATEGGGTDNGYYDWSNAYIILENL